MLFTLHATPTTARQSPLAGHWEGFAEHQGAKTEVLFDFRADDGGGLRGTQDIPAFGSLGMDLSEVTLSSGSVRLAAEDVGSTFEGTLKGDAIDGTFQMLGVEGDFHLERRAPRPLPYRTEEVSFSNGDIKLAGTLFLPSAESPRAALVLAPSSGPSTRKDFFFLADHFARRGVAALVYDKRGAGASAPDFDWGRASLGQMAGDALAGVRLLRARAEFKSLSIGLYGQSNSAWVVGLAAARSRLPDFVVMVSGGGVPGPQSELYRVRRRMTEEGFNAAETRRALAYMKLKFEVGRTGRGWARLHALAERDKEEKWFQLLNAPDSLERLREAWRGEFRYDPAVTLRRVRCPVLALFGEADTFVPPAESARNIERVLKSAGHVEYLVKTFPRAEHGLLVFPREGESWHWPFYAPGYLETLTDWVLDRARK